jgi:hypothetical protein
MLEVPKGKLASSPRIFELWVHLGNGLVSQWRACQVVGAPRHHRYTCPPRYSKFS